MDRDRFSISKSERPFAVAAAAGSEINDELTIILNGVAATIAMLDYTHPALPLLVDVKRAVERCTWRSCGLIGYSARKGVMLPYPMEFARLLD